MDLLHVSGGGRRLLNLACIIQLFCLTTSLTVLGAQSHQPQPQQVAVPMGGSGPTATPSMTPAPIYVNRGAARQMYGSGQLRPPGSNPIYGTASNPQQSRRQPPGGLQLPPPPPGHGGQRLGMIPLPFLPMPHPLPEGFPIIVHHPDHRGASVIPIPRSGATGGRRDYDTRSRYPVDHVFIPGKGFPNRDTRYGGIPIRNGGYGHKYSGMGTLRNPDEHELTFNEDDNHPCGGDCAHGEFMCIRSCICIGNQYRCDGQLDCDGEEDELECGELEMARNSKCEDTDRYVRCPTTGKCINKDWLCDGEDDCGDFSDETHCGYTLNCTEEEFECENGFCIPSTWLCDNDNDCKDLSDEVNCTRTGCTDDEFQCNDGSCISLAWKCDREIDCSDDSDEAECEMETTACGEGEFQCNTQKCIRIEFKCDGDDDCDDWSDEDDCPKNSGNCATGEFKCNSGKCIPERWRCDFQQDCDDNEDENHCDLPSQRKCSSEEFSCNTGFCILKSWVCDGISDCHDGEDEAKCEIICDDSKFACSGPGQNETSTVFCINKKHVCDGQRDCPKGEDEKECPTKVTCDKNTNCTQLCVETADLSRACSCNPGYVLDVDGVTCNDINECLYETDPVCSQTCNNTVGSFRCGCMTGYILRPDLRTCKALGAPPTLLFANRIDIRQVSLSNTKYTGTIKGLHNAIALDYHYEKGYVFWSDVSIDVIRRAYINGTGIMDIIKGGLESPGGVALDWIHNLLFLTDSGTRRVEVATLDGKLRAIVAADDLDKPRAIAVHPGEALVFWTDWGPNPKIEKAEMDGSNRKSIVTESVFWPNGLTLDYTTNRIYWADAKHNVIEAANFDGSDRKKIISKGLPHPFAITLFEDAIYWTDWHTKSISTANKATGAGLRVLHSNLHFPMDIHSYHSQRQPKYPNHCGSKNGGCSHICLPNRKSYTCVCPMGQRLKPDGKKCQIPDKMLLFARKKDLRIKQLDENAAHQHEVVIPVDGIKSAVALAWDSASDSIFWTDVEKDTINRACWNGSNQHVIINSNLVSPAGLALDWITNKLYWTDAGTVRVEVSNIDGTMRSLLIWEGLDKPRDIVVDPIGGFMYWSDWGSKPKIERAAMDGTMRSTLISHNLTWPNGLAIDHSNGKIYWADGGTKQIECANVDGTKRKVLIENDLPHPFSLDVFGSFIYWTDWETSSIYQANKNTGANRTVLGTDITGLMDVRVFHRSRKIIKTPCNTNNGGCTHLCLLKPKGHSCGCPTGIKLLEDGRTCPSGPTNSLIFAHRVDIRQISLDVPYLVDVVLPLPPLKIATSVDVDRKTGEIYWSDTAEDVIQKAKPDGTDIKTVIFSELETADGIAIDSTGRKIYWTDGGRNSIEVAELDGKNRKVLFWSELDSPRAITLHYHHGLMFWSDWGTNARIEQAWMDGNNRKAIVTTNLGWPNGLAIDRPAGRLYWNDGKRKTIESSDLQGKDRRIIIADVQHPYGLVVVGTHMYWTDWQTEAIHRADKINGSDRMTIRDKLQGMMDIRSVQSDNIAENACGVDNGKCSHLCLRNPQSYSCACPTGVLHIPESDKNCHYQPSKYLLFATKSALARVSLDTPELWDVTLTIDNVNHAYAVDYHWEEQLIFYSDIELDIIKKVNMKNLSDSEIIVSVNISTPNGLAVDWVADNIYWSDTVRKVIEVAKLDGSCRKTIIKEHLDEPRSIALFPRRALLFWSDWGGTPKIERSYLDGSNRKTIIDTDLGFPNGLTVDYTSQRLYWSDALKDRIETADVAGRSRVQLIPIATHPFGLTQFDEFIYWTDWYDKTVVRADKTSGKHAVIIRTDLERGLEIKAVAAEKQQGWNPCAEENGGCTHLCLFVKTNYTCACPDIPDERLCKKEPKFWHPLKRGKGHDVEYDDTDEDELLAYPDNNSNYGDTIMHSDKGGMTIHFIIISLMILSIILLGILIVIIALMYRKRKKKYLYATGRSVMTFSNPNYYSNNPEQAPPTVPDKKSGIWKRLKYDKSQERVYEDKSVANSPEVASLIPPALTPSSSNCEAVTPELEHSPSVTPLHRLETMPQII